jgi:hypothetical protein
LVDCASYSEENGAKCHFASPCASEQGAELSVLSVCVVFLFLWLGVRTVFNFNDCKLRFFANLLATSINQE